jgi:hypothetical protein
MVLTVRVVIPDYVEGMPSASTALWLAVGVLTGVVTYVAAIAALWLAMGRPGGAERHILDLAQTRLRRGVAASAGNA